MESETDIKNLESKVKEYLDWEFNNSNIKIVRDLLMLKKHEQLKNLMKRVEFATVNGSGLHAEVGPGYANINELVMIQTAQGILRYLEKTDKSNLKQNGVVVAFDHRTNDKYYAQLITGVFLRAGYSVKFFKDYITTSLVAFGTALFRCSLGILITGTFEAKNYSGMRLFNITGTGIIPPVDRDIQEFILKNLEPWDDSDDLEIMYDNKKLINPSQKTLLEYLNNIAKGIIAHHKELNRRAALTFTYTCLHGIAFKYASKVFELTNLTLLAVPEQKDPNPDFPTVRKPDIRIVQNLELAYKFAEEQKSNVIFFSDPDGKRLCVAEKNAATGRWYTFQSHEVAAILAWWTLFCYKERFPKESLKEIYMVNTVVSSKILRTIGQKEGFHNAEAFLGFSFIGAKMEELKKKNRKVLLANDETMSYACGNDLFVSDGVVAAYQIATCCSFLFMDGLMLVDKLNEIWTTYGHHIRRNGMFNASGTEKINKLFEAMRNTGGKNKYARDICNKKFAIQRVKDYTTGFDSDVNDIKDPLPYGKELQMIHYSFTNGFYCTFMKNADTSVKYYMEMVVPPGQANREVIMSVFNEMAEACIIEFLDPAKNVLITV